MGPKSVGLGGRLGMRAAWRGVLVLKGLLWNVEWVCCAVGVPVGFWRRLWRDWRIEGGLYMSGFLLGGSQTLFLKRPNLQEF